MLAYLDRSVFRILENPSKRAGFQEIRFRCHVRGRRNRIGNMCGTRKNAQIFQEEPQDISQFMLIHEFESRLVHEQQLFHERFRELGQIDV